MLSLRRPGCSRRCTTVRKRAWRESGVLEEPAVAAERETPGGRRTVLGMMGWRRWICWRTALSQEEPSEEGAAAATTVTGAAAAAAAGALERWGSSAGLGGQEGRGLRAVTGVLPAKQWTG